MRNRRFTDSDVGINKKLIGGPGRNRTGIRGFAVRCITTLPPDPQVQEALYVRQNAQGQVWTTIGDRLVQPNRFH